MLTKNRTKTSAPPIPIFPLRWFILFRLYPTLLFDARFLLRVLAGREPIYWHNVMEHERRRISRLGGDPPPHTCAGDKMRVAPPPGAWRGDEPEDQ